MIYLYNTFFFQPLLNLLVLFYNTVAFKDLGVAIILLTVLVRLVLYPLFSKSLRQQAALQKLQPQVKDIQKKHPKDREAQTKATLALYREHKVNPFGGFLLLLLQLPVLIALFQIFLHIFDTFNADLLYSFVLAPEAFNQSFLGLISLNEKSIVMLLLAGLATYAQSYFGQPTKSSSSPNEEQLARTMKFLGPVLTLFILNSLPGGWNAVALYWIVSSLFSVVQQMIVKKNTVA